MNPYDKLLNRKRTWQPVQTEAGKVKEGAEETIYRALAIRHMELPVGDFIKDALKKNDVNRKTLIAKVKKSLSNKFKQSFALYARVLQIAKAEENLNHFGYNSTFKSTEFKRIAILGLGYADGYPRLLSNKAEVFVAP